MRLLIFALTLLALSASLSAHAAERIVLNTAAAEPLHRGDQSGFIDRVVADAFRRIGRDVLLIQLPAERALINANAGIDDGDAQRIAGLEKLYPNLVRVPESNMVMEFVAFTRRPGLRLDGWSSLAGHSVGVIGGWKILERQIPEGVDVTRVKNAAQLFALLDAGRIDLAIFSRWQGTSIVERLGIRDVHIAEPALADQEVFIYLHKRHAGLVPGLAEALRAAKADGTYQRLVSETLSPVSTH